MLRSRSSLFGLGLVGLVQLLGTNAEFEARTLVILDDPTVPQSHSTFFKQLQSRGHKLSFISAKDRSLRLGKFGKFDDYDNAILFSPKTEDFGGDFDTEHMMKFIDSGKNALIITDTDPTETNREIANECGVDFDPKGSMIIDHVTHDKANDDGTHTKVIGSIDPKASSIVGSIDAPVVFSGLGHTLNEDTELAFKILTGSPTSYSDKLSKKIESQPRSTGKESLLVSGIQARNNARLVFAASKDLFSNKFFYSPVECSKTGKKYESPGNEAFVNELTKWNFQEKGLLRAVNFTHKSVGAAESEPSTYRIKDDISVSVVLQEYDSKTDAWQPFVADDVQLEFVMLDPYIRTYMKHVGEGEYTSKFKAPDVFGIYKFVIDYQRVGYSSINLEHKVGLRPYRHSEFDRFLTVAYPYYASAFSMMAGFFVFGLYFLYGELK